MRKMTEPEWRAFVMDGTRTAKVATAGKDGRPHVVPVWFVLDGEDVVFTTAATRIGGRYMGQERAAEFGARNAVEGELLVRLRPAHVLAEAELTE
jgi:nitroimidazol reductase NimA-like FMN-containing flavoprotein (pyridoxamine 5'-phosphate oxidase superfamily)